MVKKLDKLIFKSFIGPFIITFFIACFVLTMQILWKYVDDLVGKGLDLLTIAQFLWYASASLLTLAMPIAILISSIMTFGNLGETFELIAIKSAGISLLRFMRPVGLFAILLCYITFLFANYVIPYANLKFFTLYNDIYYKRPAFDLKEGVFFTHIPNYAIKIDKKDEDGKTIRNVMIYDQTNPLQDNTIIAEKGIMRTSEDKNYLEFNLQNGYRYQEQGMPADTSTEFIRLKFREFKKLFDLSILQKQNTSDSIFRNNYRMLSARQLNTYIDSLVLINDSLTNKRDLFLTSYFHYREPSDSLWKSISGIRPAKKWIPDSIVQRVQDRSLASVSELKNSLQFGWTNVDLLQKEILSHKIEWHRKFSISLICLILFFIGAPLGSIIRKGGMGMPLVVAIILFLAFHLLNMFGEKFVKEGIVDPFTGMWLAVLVLTPVSIFFTYKATHDSQLFSKEFYYRVFNKVWNLLGPAKNNIS